MFLRLMGLCVVVAVLAAPQSGAGESDAADLRLRISSGEILRYNWNIDSTSQSSGRELGKPFTLTTNTVFGMMLVLRGFPHRGEQTPVSLRLQDLSFIDRRSINEDSKTELLLSKSKVKYTENGKVLMDSENDIGLERLPEYQQHIKTIENGEMRVALDAAGRQSDMQGESALVETFKNNGVQSIFPILAGKEVKPGDFWTDSLSMAQIGGFKLSRPATVRSKMTFARWETKDGKRLALIEMVASWDKQDLKGEHPDGLLVEITRVDGTSTGTCLFDPSSGQFVEGSIAIKIKYRLDGERDGQSTGLDVNAKTSFSFAAKTDK